MQKQSLIAEIEQQHSKLTEIRQYLHSIPELAFNEYKTATYITSLLKQWNIPIITNIAQTGIVGIIKKGNSSAGVGLRADMDALPITEQNQFSYKSGHDGNMHACGHDGHMAMLLGAAQYLSKQQFDGCIYLIFQPAEENGGGALRMIEDNLLEKCPMQAIFAMHNIPNIAAGKVASSPGAVLASSSGFFIDVIGKGGHAAMPHLCQDPIPVAAQLINALQSIVSRNLNPLESAVVSVTKIHGGSTDNVIANQCSFQGTVRTFSAQVLSSIEQRFIQLTQSFAQAFNVQIKLRFEHHYPATINNLEQTQFMREVIVKIVGEQNLIEQTPLMASEDFSFFLQNIPGSYCFIGNGKHDDNTRLHSANFDFNDQILPIGASILAKLALDWLAQHTS